MVEKVEVVKVVEVVREVRVVRVAEVVTAVEVIGEVEVIRAVEVVRVVELVRMVHMIGMIWMDRETWASSHRIVHGSTLAWRRRVGVAGSSTTVVGRIIERITGGNIFANMRRRISRVIRITVDAHVRRRRGS